MTREPAALRGNIGAVVIGASAGGVEALSVLLPALPEDCVTPVFVVIHLPRDRPSLLVDVFASKCSLDVREAQDKEPVAAGTVYFAPANYHLLLDRGPQLALSADDLVHHSRPSIDVLFESAADVYRERLLGIILTGANEDGAAGLAAVHDAGGVTVVQAPETAQSPLMVLSALKLRSPDLVLPLEEIAALLRTLTAQAVRSPKNVSASG
jgi:two-component system, chemotaxis family, protein-glutamate methylesterase/glutaminase